jgi:hypothetical protein
MTCSGHQGRGQGIHGSRHISARNAPSMSISGRSDRGRRSRRRIHRPSYKLAPERSSTMVLRGNHRRWSCRAARAPSQELADMAHRVCAAENSRPGKASCQVFGWTCLEVRSRKRRPALDPVDASRETRPDTGAHRPSPSRKSPMRWLPPRRTRGPRISSPSGAGRAQRATHYYESGSSRFTGRSPAISACS